MDDALQESAKVQEEASSLGFDWPDITGVLEKVREEISEIEVEIERNDIQAAQRELGDLMLITVNLARFLKTDPEKVLRQATHRFSARFDKVKRAATDAGIDMKASSIDDLNQLWAQAKKCGQ